MGLSPFDEASSRDVADEVPPPFGEIADPFAQGNARPNFKNNFSFDDRAKSQRRSSIVNSDTLATLTQRIEDDEEAPVAGITPFLSCVGQAQDVLSPASADLTPQSPGSLRSSRKSVSFSLASPSRSTYSRSAKSVSFSLPSATLADDLEPPRRSSLSQGRPVVLMGSDGQVIDPNMFDKPLPPSPRSSYSKQRRRMSSVSNDPYQQRASTASLEPGGSPARRPSIMSTRSRRGSVAGWDPNDNPFGDSFYPRRGMDRLMSTGGRSYVSTLVQEEPKEPYDAETELRSASKLLLVAQKWGLCFCFYFINGLFIWASTTSFHTTYWYLFLPLISVNTFSQVTFALCVMISAARSWTLRNVLKHKDSVPDIPEKFVMVLPVYNEDRTEMQNSLNSLVRQIKIEEHPRVIMCIVDGKAKACGETMSTQEFLMTDFFKDGITEDYPNGYSARDGFFMPVTIKYGTYEGIPYILIAKHVNQGKRDSLCFIRSFLYHYRVGSEDVSTMFNPEVFDCIASFLVDNGLDTVDYLCGMDGDTEFDVDCIYELIKGMRRGGPETVGVCGAVLVKFDENPWGFWNLLQNTEYNMTQGLRREFQSRVTGKVNCLPGCCQLIRITEATFGDTVLRERFGHVPKPNDTITKQIMGVYSEDSIHASIIFQEFPASLTRQALGARAYTTAPQSWSVYLSQRKRWALGSKSNEFVMIFRKGINPIERLCSLITVITWWVGPFVVSAFVFLAIALVRDPGAFINNKLTIGLLAVLGFRYVYSFMVITWFPHTWLARWRFFLGYWVYLTCSPFMNIIVTFYALFHCDEFSWGKTRAVAAGDVEAGHGHDPTGVKGKSPMTKEEIDMEKFTSRGPPI